MIEIFTFLIFLRFSGDVLGIYVMLLRNHHFKAHGQYWGIFNKPIRSTYFLNQFLSVLESGTTRWQPKAKIDATVRRCYLVWTFVRWPILDETSQTIKHVLVSWEPMDGRSRSTRVPRNADWKPSWKQNKILLFGSYYGYGRCGADEIMGPNAWKILDDNPMITLRKFVYNRNIARWQNLSSHAIHSDLREPWGLWGIFTFLWV